MFPSVAESEVLLLKRDSDGTLVEDAYCLRCGYNLRGLTGEPIVCPECGHANELGVISIPAAMIQKALADMESSPTSAAGAAFMFATTLPLCLFSDVPWLWFLPVAAPTLWLAAALRMRGIYRNQPGWGKVLWDFHLALLLLTFFFLSMETCAVLYGRGLMNDVGPWLIVTVLLTVPLFWYGLQVYSRARWDIAEMQREAAVQIARGELRKALQRSKR